jgi:glutathione S-transferase
VDGAMITLYHHGSSVCAAKVRLVLAEKSLPWDGIYVDILRGDQFDPAYMKLNAKAVVPTLVHDGKVIIESSVICEYLDEAFPAPPLKPNDRRSARRCGCGPRRWTNICIRPALSSPSPPAIASSSAACRRKSSTSFSKARHPSR